MNMNSTAVDDYLALINSEKLPLLQQLRNVIRSSVPEAEEGIFWNMPGYRWNGPLVYYAAYKNHVGFYPGPEIISAFSDRLSAFKTSKGAVQFDYQQELPIDLIKAMVIFRMNANERKKAFKNKSMK